MPDRTRSNEDESENSKPTDGGDVDDEEENTNRRTADYYETNFRNSRGESYRNRGTVEVEGEEWSVDTLVDLRRLKQERSETWVRLVGVLDDGTTIQVVAGILRPGPTGYDDLVERTGATRRTVENHVYSLRDAGVIQVGGNPAEISFVDDEVRLLASDVLSFLS
jgi:DNA-binding transcriptional ArsR family regulator